MKLNRLLLSASILLASCASPGLVMNQETVVSMTAQDIREMNPLVEHGAYIYCNDPDDCFSSDIVTGGPVSISGDQLNTIRDFDRTDDIVGFIHNHPMSTEGTNTFRYLLDVLNRMPSTQDYVSSTFTALEGDYKQDYTIYIIGPDAVLRSYPLP